MDLDLKPNISALTLVQTLQKSKTKNSQSTCLEKLASLEVSEPSLSHIDNFAGTQANRQQIVELKQIDKFARTQAYRQSNTSMWWKIQKRF